MKPERSCYTYAIKSMGEKGMKRCFIFAAGSFYGLRERPADGDAVIAADAGYRVCQTLGIVPDLLLGDFDSMPQPEDFSRVYRVPVEKDDTDTMLAVKTALEWGCGEVFLYGGTGGTRLDHTLANLQSLLYLRRHGARGWLYDRNFIWTVVENETLALFDTVEDGLFSVFCMGDRAEGVDLEGFQYPLINGTLTPDFPLGVSNHVRAANAVVRVQQGCLTVGWELPDVLKLE